MSRSVPKGSQLRRAVQAAPSDGPAPFAPSRVDGSFVGLDTCNELREASREDRRPFHEWLDARWDVLASATPRVHRGRRGNGHDSGLRA